MGIGFAIWDNLFLFTFLRGPHAQNINQIVVAQILGFVPQTFVASDRIAKILPTLVALLAQLLRVIFQLLLPDHWATPPYSKKRFITESSDMSRSSFCSAEGFAEGADAEVNVGASIALWSWMMCSLVVYTHLLYLLSSRR